MKSKSKEFGYREMGEGKVCCPACYAQAGEGFLPAFLQTGHRRNAEPGYAA